MMKNWKLNLALVLLALPCSISVAQFPGDGIPDVYFVVDDAVPIFTSVGEITRPVGSIVVDTDGNDMVALLIEGPNLLETTPDDGNYLVGSTSRLPDPFAPAPLFASDWTNGFIAGKSQWVRTNPLSTPGFVGVIGEYEDPFNIFPDEALAFWDGAPSALVGAAVTFATSESGTFATNPEPGQMPMGPVSVNCLCNFPPFANDDEYTVAVGGILNVPAPGVLSNDVDDGYPAALTAELEMDVTDGTLMLNPDGSFTYTHTGLTATTDSFTYTAFDGYESSNVATATINVVPEPISMIHVGTAVLGMLALRRRWPVSFPQESIKNTHTVISHRPASFLPCRSGNQSTNHTHRPFP